MIPKFPAPQSWKCDEALELSAANRLTLLYLAIPNLKFYARNLIACPRNSSTNSGIIGLICAAKKIDWELECWALTIPSESKPWTKEVYLEQPEEVFTAEVWPGPIHQYRDLPITGVWNDYRASRIACQAVILDCINALPSHLQTDQLERMSKQAANTSQQMVDDICSSIPFLLAYDSKSRKDQSQNETGAYYASLLRLKYKPHISQRLR